ncbi:MAG: hypothetical protein OXF02_04605 [Simkaniaceae bacterium]|nr:hypothetical protein [Simkaniaceae bacterium]
MTVSGERRRFLLITSSGGGGHLRAARAFAMKIRATHPDCTLIEADILTDWLGKYVGRLFARMWNASQRGGRLRTLRLLSGGIPTLDLLFRPVIFSKALVTITSHNIDTVIDMQPLGTSAIIRAVETVSRTRRKRLTVEKVITELPTDFTVHFFKPIKRLTDRDRKFLRLVSTPPLSDSGKNADRFWMSNCGMRASGVRYEDFPLRKEFEQYRRYSAAPFPDMVLRIALHDQTEKRLITGCVRRGNGKIERRKKEYVVSIRPADKVSTILLGSQPTETATVRYVRCFIEMEGKRKRAGVRHLLFVFCNADGARPGSLMKRVCTAVEQVRHYPHHLTVIPMGVQGAEVIAPLYYRSNATFTRSGGLTAMELISVSRGEIRIHSEVKGEADQETLSYGMPAWERGNALYLRKIRGAGFISPDTFTTGCAGYFNDY